MRMQTMREPSIDDQLWPDVEDLGWFQSLDPLKLLSLVAISLALTLIALCAVVWGLSRTGNSRDDDLSQRVTIQQVEIDNLRAQLEIDRAAHP